MTTTETSPECSAVNKSRKPVLAVMGEFSVGKSTLTNLLLGSEPLPVKVTATQLPPVWISYGDQEPFREDLEGNIHPVDLGKIDEIPLEQTSVIRLFLKADILEMCDFIDMPGISDPNMSSDIWQRVIHHADGVLWCTHATQAWRQSEAAVWKAMSPDLFSKSYLLITRIDKLLTLKDRSRVEKRVRRETQGLFAEVFPISLTQAVAATDDREQWEQSGAEAFSQSLIDLLHKLNVSLEPPESPNLRKPVSENEGQETQKIFQLNARVKEEQPCQVAVSPVRVKLVSSAGTQSARPSRHERQSLTTEMNLANVRDV